ncbi:hypothetical protein pb186bvf_021220, partial [Paramecium bursaria]
MFIQECNMRMILGSFFKNLTSQQMTYLLDAFSNIEK